MTNEGNVSLFQFGVDDLVAVKDEYRENPALKGCFEGKIISSNLIGTTMVYNVQMNSRDSRIVNITHGALIPISGNNSNK